MRRLPVLGGAEPVAAARADPPLRGERLLAALEAPFLALERQVARVVPPALDPLAQLGAIANLHLLVATLSGALLLFWYSASVHTAYSSLQALRGDALGQLVRSLHRYSSDAAMLFVVLHALRLTGARRFAGARWLAWVTGAVLVGALWLVGWLGYWLVWDEPARQVALGSSKLLDVLPVFVEPMTRSFLTDGSVQSLLFFIVFFLHMLLPLAMGIALWLHITRLQRSRFFTTRPMTLAVLASLLVVSLAVPAVSGEPARMLVHPGTMPIDGFYLLPIVVTDRLGGGALWALALLPGVALFSLPWALARRRAQVARVDLPRCNGCRTCATDCPYGAIQMVPRSDGRAHEVEARVDPAKCVGCGICAGSCNSAGIGVPLVSQVEARARLDRWLEAEPGDAVAFVCAHSGGGRLELDPTTGRSASLPGYRVVPVPCVGWVHPLTVERALRRGARGALVVGCGPTEPPYREGLRWAEERLGATREPRLRLDRAPAERVRVVRANRLATLEVRREAERFLAGAPPPPPPGRAARLGAWAALAVLFTLPLAYASRVPYAPPPRTSPELVVSFRHAGSNQERCRDVPAEENARLPPHMRRPRVCDRGRAPVRLRVEVDGQPALERTYPPKGLRGDGPSLALETLTVAPGEHEISVALGDTHDGAAWTYTDRRRVRFGETTRAVALFDRGTGFTWAGGEP
ncbi:MAG: hydrogenase iron-sulfur subunit [Polyangiaceae bacterium]|nr:hydrogenase iron-sulfur subunit [Polyangiaceae bacterium]